MTDNAACHICHNALNNPADPTSKDCGGDCLRCMALAGDPECQAELAQLASYEREWWVFSTALSEGSLMLRCIKTGALGVVKDPSKQEWSDAYYAPSNPYRWHEPERVDIVSEDDPKYAH